MISPAALSGYLLEEVLAKMLASSGYRLLVDAEQDHDALTVGKHGLLVHGRGADHQADALGDLAVPIPFSLPVRLFLEAKFKGQPVGLTDVRNALAVVTDVNERYSTDGAQGLRLPFRRYHYRYSLFSMSGFTGPAQDFALAHQISLVDMQGAAFEGLREMITQATNELLELAARSNITVLPTQQARMVVRVALGTMDGRHVAPEADAHNLLPERPLRALADALARQVSGDRLVLGFLKAPFLLALQPDDVHEFKHWLRHAPAHVEVRIRFARGGPVEGDWVIIPDGAPRGARLRFGIPARLLEWLVSGEALPAELAAQAKQEFFSSVVIFYHTGRSVELRLIRPNAGWLTRDASPTLSRYDQLKEDLTDPDLPEPPIWRRRDADATHTTGSWTTGAAGELLRRLEDEGWVAQTLVLRAVAINGGRITRQQIFSAAGFSAERTLRGFLRPVERITSDLESEGRLQPEVAPALKREPPTGSELVFVSPPVLVRVLRQM
jgi:hypothetical protein